MAGKEVDIRFNTNANTKGAKEVKKSVDEIRKSFARQEREVKKVGWVSETSLENVEEAAAELRRELDRIDGIDPKLRKDLEKVGDSMDRATRTARKLTAAQKEGKKANSKAALGFLEVSRAVEDAQYGMRGVLNNIPQIITLFGGGAGLAGVVSLAAVGVSQLFTLFSENEEVIEDTNEAIEEMVTQLTNLKEEADEAKFENFLRSIDRVKNQIAVQNAEIRANINLQALQRAASLELAEAQDKLQRTQIAIRQATDPNFTASDAAIANAELDAAKLAREAAEKKSQIEDEITLKLEKRAEQEQLIEANQEKKNQLLKEEEEIRERIADLESKTAFIRLLEDEKIPEAKQRIDDIDKNTVVSVSRRPIKEQRLAEARQRLVDLKAELQQEGNFEEAESSLRAARTALKRNQSSIKNTEREIIETTQSIDLLDVQIEATQEAAEISNDKINRLTDLQLENLIRQTELSTTLKDSTQIFQKNVLPELEEALRESEMVRDDGTKRAIAQIEEMANNQISDLDEKDRLFAAFRVLQSRGFEQTGTLIFLTEQLVNKIRGQEGRIRALESKVKQVGGRQ